MASLNKVILIGNLGQDPEITYMPNGGAVTRLSVATSESWRDKQTGDERQATEWHRVVIFGKLAEIAAEYLKQGSQVYLEGQNKTRKWTDQQGVERYTTEVVLSMNGVMQNLGSKQQQQSRPQQQQQQQQQSRPQQQPQPSAPPVYNEPPMDFSDDIPFAPIGLQYPALLNCM